MVALEGKKDCFAMKYGKCTVLNETECENCKFFKSKEQFKEENKKQKRGKKYVK